MALEARVEFASIGLEGAAVVHGDVVAVLGLARAFDFVGCFDAQLGAEGEGESRQGGEEGCETHFVGALGLTGGTGVGSDIEVESSRGDSTTWSAEVEVGFGGSAFRWGLLILEICDNYLGTHFSNRSWV